MVVDLYHDLFIDDIGDVVLLLIGQRLREIPLASALLLRVDDLIGLLHVDELLVDGVFQEQ